MAMYDPTTNPRALRALIRRNLRNHWRSHNGGGRYRDHTRGDSAVVLLLGRAWDGRRFGREAGIFLNKRSLRVRQPGDICCPGGGLDPRKDWRLARLLTLPGIPCGVRQWRAETGGAARRGVALALATALREAWEEMRLNPLRFRFLGPLPAECLSLFQRRIYPLVGWTRRQKRFKPNWEVAAVPFIPLADLLDPSRYVALRLVYGAGRNPSPDRFQQRFTAFRFTHSGAEEILWGATFRIVVRFLDLNFGFRPPALERLPTRSRVMTAAYMGGH